MPTEFQKIAFEFINKNLEKEFVTNAPESRYGTKTMYASNGEPYVVYGGILECYSIRDGNWDDVQKVYKEAKENINSVLDSLITASRYEKLEGEPVYKTYPIAIEWRRVPEVGIDDDPNFDALPRMKWHIRIKVCRV